MPMRRPSRANALAELPPELEARISALERNASGADFDAASWFWMILFGVLVPALLLLLGALA